MSESQYKKAEAQYRKLLDRANKWQEAQLKVLAKRTYLELSKLPKRSKLEPPAHLKELKFIIHRGPGDEGGVEIAVQRVFGRRGIDESRLGPYFEIFPDNKVVYPTFVHDPLD
jgi:hypothetical protein